MPVCSCCSMWCGFVGVVIVVWCSWLAFDFVVLAAASWFNVVVLVFRFAFLVEFCVYCITAWFTFGWWFVSSPVAWRVMLADVCCFGVCWLGSIWLWLDLVVVIDVGCCGCWF